MPIKYIIVLIYACFLLVSCSTPISPSAQEDKELAMIEEKLSLKAKIFELEEQIRCMQEEEDIAYLVDGEIYRFLLAIQDQNINEVEKRVTEEAEVQSTHITFENGASLFYRNFNEENRIQYLRLRKYNLHENTGSFLYEFYQGNKESQMVLVSIDVVKEEKSWRIRHVTKEV